MVSKDEFEVVVFDFSPTGQITVQTTGFEGASCIDTIRDIEEGLGEVTHVEHTAEFHRKNVQKAKQKNVVRRK